MKEDRYVYTTDNFNISHNISICNVIQSVYKEAKEINTVLTVWLTFIRYSVSS